MSDTPAAYDPRDAPSVIFDAHRRRWHDQEVFLAAQLRILREQQSAAELATSLLDLHTAIPGAASVAYRVGEDGTAELAGITDSQGLSLYLELPRGGIRDEAQEVSLGAVILAISRTAPAYRRAWSVPASDGAESVDIATIIRRAANGLTRRKPDAEFDPLTFDERQVLVAAAYEGFDAYSARLVGEWEKTDEELAPIQRQ